MRIRSKIIIAMLFLALFAFAPCLAQEGILRSDPRSVKMRPTFVLSLYNFNIQYVIGDSQTQNRIVRESLEPLLDMYLRHPDWGCDVGMQALFLDFLDAFYPDVLKKLRTLVERGQVEVVSYNYEHTLALAYPRHDWDWGNRLTNAVFERLDLKRAPVAYLHEAQFGWGVADTMKDGGAAAAVVSAGTIERLHGAEALSPLYKYKEGYVIPAPSAFVNTWFGVQWNYFGYGEAALTNPPSPTQPNFAFDSTKAAEHERKIMSLASNEGYRIARISDFVDFAGKTSFTPPAMPPVPDSNRGGEDTAGFFLWMGWYMSPLEKDYEALAAAYAARNELVLAETLISYAKTQGADTLAEESLLVDAWRAALRAEAAGATGWHPEGFEVTFVLDVAKQAHETAVNIIRNLKIKLGMSAVEIDASTGTVTPAPTTSNEPPISNCPVYPVITGALDGYSAACRRISDTETEMTLGLSPQRWGLSLVVVAFPLLGNRLQFSPGLMEQSLADYGFADFKQTEFVLPLSNGLVGLGDGKTFVITHNDTSHLAAHVSFAGKTVSFKIKDAPAQIFTLKFSIVTGDASVAVNTANRINTFPKGLR